MKNWLIPLCCTWCFFQSLTAQSLAPEVVSSNGGTGTAASLQLEWTLGELAVEGRTGQQRSFTEGFHQPALLVEQVPMPYPHISTRSERDNETSITLAPNPVSTELTVRFDFDTPERLSCQVRDANGALLSGRTMNTLDGNAQIDVTDLVPGLYFIHFITADDGAVTVFKVVKIK